MEHLARQRPPFPRPVSILTRGKPRVEHAWPVPNVSVGLSFNPHSRKTPSGTEDSAHESSPVAVSILTRGKPRVEPSHAEKFSARPLVSILTRGKPRVEQGMRTGEMEILAVFQSSLEENPEWNLLLQSSGAISKVFQSSLEENPEWNLRIGLLAARYLVFQSSLEENPEWNASR